MLVPLIVVLLQLAVPASPSSFAETIDEPGIVRSGLMRTSSVQPQLEKPDIAIFRAALQRAGVRPEEAVHIGDSVHADVEGALNAGISPILLDRRGRYAEHPARLPAGTRAVRTLAELPAAGDAVVAVNPLGRDRDGWVRIGQ